MHSSCNEAYPCERYCNFFSLADKRRREETVDPSSNDDLPSVVEYNSHPGTRNRSSSDLTNIKPKPTSQDTLHSMSRKNNNNGTNPSLMSPFRNTFILSPESSDALLDSDPSSWGDISSFDKDSCVGKNLALSKLTSPGTRGKARVLSQLCNVPYFCPPANMEPVCKYLKTNF